MQCSGTLLPGVSLKIMQKREPSAALHAFSSLPLYNLQLRRSAHASLLLRMAAWAAAILATGTRYGEQDT